MTAPGWYPNNEGPGSERYWDGVSWTAYVRPTGGQSFPGTQPDGRAAYPAAQSQKPPKNWFLRHKILSGVGVFFLLGVIGTAVNGGSSTTVAPLATDGTSSVPSGAASSAPVGETPPTVRAPEPSLEPSAKPKETSGQKNARESAEGYLSFSPFSRKGLIRQLSSDVGGGFSVADATYAVDALNTDYNEQAYKAAKNYLSISPFSRKSLIRQLSSDVADGYTTKQATFGADKALAEQ